MTPSLLTRIWNWSIPIGDEGYQNVIGHIDSVSALSLRTMFPRTTWVHFLLHSIPVWNCVLTQVVINCMKYVETHLLRRLCRCYESLSIVVQVQTRFEKVFSRAFKFECNALRRRQNLSIFLQFSVVKQTFRWHRPNTNKSKSNNATNGNGCADRLVHISLHQTKFTLRN